MTMTPLGRAARFLRAVVPAIVFSSWLAGPSAVLANDQAHQKIAEAALRETRDIISREYWRSRIPYSLEGYLLLEGRDNEGYVLFPKKP
jgi:hypothetical protein